jgi:hypothetical protein
VEPVNISLSTPGWPRQTGTDLPVARHGREHVLRQHVVEHLEERKDAQRGVLRGLGHDGVAHPQGGGDLPDRDHHRPVPRTDGADHTDGAVAQLGVGFPVVEHGLARQRGGGGGAQPRRARTDLEPGVGTVEGLALLAGQQLGERLGRGLDRAAARSSRSMRSWSGRAPQARCAARARATAASRSSTVPTGARPTISPVAGSRISRPAGSVTAASRLS